MQWSKAGLSGLQSQLAREMLSWVAAPLTGQVSWVVRGVVGPDGPSGIGRVILWDGRRLDTSVAYDVPLVDGHGGNISPGEMVAALRHGLAAQNPDGGGTSTRDSFGIPVLDGTTLVHGFIEHPHFHITDALSAAGAAFAAPLEADEPPELRLRGFLLLDERTCRLYLDTPDSEDVPPIGIDLPLRDEQGAILMGATGASAALPTLMDMGELERMRKDDARDPYCSAVYDLTGWLTGG
ncbi:hypothetical protein ACFXDP_27400 [Streptomyces sp. NPDC059374]|uniref:hypothetical protein n=1 Tax=unclassified Streptomyces TaxID=2593676 RepID=UPI0036AF2BCB